MPGDSLISMDSNRVLVFCSNFWLCLVCSIFEYLTNNVALCLGMGYGRGGGGRGGGFQVGGRGYGRGRGRMWGRGRGDGGNQA